MTRYRLRIQQFSLTFRSTLHTKIIIDNHGPQADRHADLFRAFLGAVHGNEPLLSCSMIQHHSHNFGNSQPSGFMAPMRIDALAGYGRLTRTRWRTSRPPCMLVSLQRAQLPVRRIDARTTLPCLC